MATFGRYLRLCGYIIIIVLSSVGIALSGGIPVPPRRKEDTIEMKIEQPDSSREDTVLLQHVDVKEELK